MMNLEALKLLRERRSCRSYKNEQIADAELEAVLEAGTYAPTGRGAQSPVIVAVQDRETIGRLRRMNAAIMGNPDADPFYGAPTVLVVLADKSLPTHVYDGACVMCNLLNAAHAAGLDACWIHRAREEFDSEEGKALLKQWGIEGDYEGIGHCILGYRSGELQSAAERKADYVIRVKSPRAPLLRRAGRFRTGGLFCGRRGVSGIRRGRFRGGGRLGRLLLPQEGGQLHARHLEHLVHRRDGLHQP